MRIHHLGAIALLSLTLLAAPAASAPASGALDAATPLLLGGTTGFEIQDGVVHLTNPALAHPDRPIVLAGEEIRILQRVLTIERAGTDDVS
ncbi:MAG: hypothetical protein R3185_08380, partial [Candidatus Thermoplasmatota archaeon]|nr:hypothetical protein [Candidatus Thermoplasmatota archaeon]